MTDQTTESTATPGSPERPGTSGSPKPPATPGSSGAPATPDPGRKAGFEARMEGFGREAQAAGERIGQRAQATGVRWSRDPGVVRAADTAGRVWGLLLLVGLWFVADVMLGLDMPGVPWRDVWLVGLIVIGLAVVLRGMGRRSA